MNIGTLYSLDFEDVEEVALLDDSDRLVARLEEIIEISGLEVIGEPLVHHFTPQGVTYLVVLAQSHLAASTWPEHRFMTVDFFTCGDPILGRRAHEALKRSISCRRVTERIIERHSHP